ncbi:MAG: RluA family pseudouridine synthase [Oscillochloris sp.]|nr:RluA family pseudouridine synthase [Oscillochloris sp.]
MSDNQAIPTMYEYRIERTDEPIIDLAERMLGAVGRMAAERGGIWIDGRRIADVQQPAPQGSLLTIKLPPAEGYVDVQITAADIAYEDKWLIALHKRAGWYVGPIPWDDRGHVTTALTRYLAERDSRTPNVHLVHRLDRNTSGVLLLSKDPLVNSALQTIFAERLVQKRYVGICAGQPPEQGEIITGHGRGAYGRWRLYPLEEVDQPLPAGGGRVKRAHTSYTLREQLIAAALLDVHLHTGRTHQIRLHMAHIGHPLLGDVRYGGPEVYGGLGLNGHLLHAAALNLPHPVTGLNLELNSPLPGIFRQVREA